MTVKEFLSVVAGGVRVFIKPPAKGCYYSGIAGDVPRSLLSATIEEVSPRIYEDELSRVRPYCGELGIWIRPIPEFDALVAGIEDFCNFTGEEIDSLYCFLMEAHDERIKELQTIAARQNEIKISISDYNLHCKWPGWIKPSSTTILEERIKEAESRLGKKPTK